MKKLIVYDLDGTLADTRKDIVLSVQHMLREMQAPPLEASEIQRYVGRGLYHLMCSCLKTHDMKQVEKAAKIYRNHYAAHMMDHTRLYDGALDLLCFFENRKQAVITNKPNPFSEDMLARLEVSKFFVEVVAGDAKYPKKPDPQALVALMKNENVTAGETLFIGDSLIDVETARNAGVEIAAVLHGFSSEDELKSARPDLIARDFKELKDLVTSKGW